MSRQLGPPGHDELVEGHKVPDGLELAHVSVYVRHGERTPVRKRLAGVGGIPGAEWDLCGLGRAMGAPVADQTDRGAEAGLMHVRKTYESHRANSPRTWKAGDCFWGELTDLGRTTTLRFGQQLRRLYIERLGFITDDPRRDGDSQLFFRSTSIPRAVETAEQIIRGIFPPPVTSSGRDAWTPTLVVRQPSEESLYLNTVCKPLRLLDEQYADEAAAELNDSLKPLDASLGKFTRDGKVRIDGHPRVNGLLDTVAAARVHGVPYPREFDDPETDRLLETATVHEWFNGYAKSKMLTRLAMGRLFGDLRQSFLSTLSGRSAVRFGLYSCHDTSIGGILSALECPVEKWPSFTSNLVFEVFRPSPPPRRSFASYLPSFLHLFPSPATDDVFVRLRYNSRAIQIPACAPPQNHRPGSEGELCTWKAFDEAVAKVSMTAEEWDGICAGGPAKSSKREG